VTPEVDLARRLGPAVCDRRLTLEKALTDRKLLQGTGLLRIENFLPVLEILETILRFARLSSPARLNCLDVEVIEREAPLRSLPPGFDGFRLLHLSDLHCDLVPELVDIVANLTGTLTYDAVVITGDYHDRIGVGHQLSLDLTARLVARLKPPIFGVLGNHDMLEMTPALEAAGITMLLNEAGFIERNGERLWICGIDDPHFFQTHDPARARAGIAAGETTILLSHSPESYWEAEALGYNLLLCGHTHSGQICLPGGFPIVRNARVPRRLIAGAWTHGRMSGYTSRGTGSCGLPARFHCRPEITLHVLRQIP